MEVGTRSHPLFTLEFQWLLVCVFIPAVCLQWNGNLSAYNIASFDNPVKPTLTVTTRLDHFTLHPDTEDVYVGAVNYIYRLNKNLAKVANVSTATCTGRTCLNYNKVLVLQDGRLVTCGSENGGRCHSRREGDLIDDGRGNDGGFQVAAFGTKTTESIVAQGHGDQSDPRLYVATSYGTEDEGRGDIPPVTRRLLEGGDEFMDAGDDDIVTFYTSSYKSNPFPINYVSAFVWNGFTYFVTCQGTSPGQVNPHTSKIIRVCQSGNNLDSYSEIFIQCSGPGNSVFSLVQAAHVGPAGPHLSDSLALDAADQVLYAVFASNQGDDSALCMYKMSDVEAEFEDAVRGCLTVGNAYRIAYLQGGLCSGALTDSQINLHIGELLCQARFGPIGYQYATGMEPGLSSVAVTALPGHLASSIITNIALNHTLAFIGTSQGQLLKVHIESRDSAILYEKVSLDGESVMRDTKLNETTEELYVLTEQKLIKMRVENCSQYTSCVACIGTEARMDGDPYCGWCTLERRCTRYHDCQLPDVSSRWLAYNDAQCIKIAEVAPHNSLPITLTDQQITLKVQQLPRLHDGQQYVCRFGDLFDDQAITTGETLRCMSPPGNRIPDILSPEDHVTVVLSVMSTETTVKIADIDFSFYECNTHRTCLSCVDSDWACDWCVFENRCTHNSSTCTGPNEIIITGRNNRNSLMEGPHACPQLLTQDGEVLVPNAVSRAITVNVSNLPEPSLISGYRCSLDIEGSPQSMAATRVDSTLTCNPRAYTYTANEQELNVTLMAYWTDVYSKTHLLGDRHGFKVTLYKCEVLRPDCSRCVSEETSREELGCVWCGASEGTCGVSDSAACLNAGRIVTLDNMLNCPVPLIQKVYPLYGPIEGNTRLTLTGTDLGRRFSDLRGVTVGGQLCDLIGQEFYYSTGGSISCITGGSSDLTPQSLQVTITGADGTEQSSSQEDQTFQYNDPVITDFSPKVGPQSGGTLVTISGENLDTGRSIEASLEDMPCRVERSQVSDTSITCLTSKAEQLGSWTLSVSFDGAARSSGMDYRYAKDPEVVHIQPTSSVLAGGRELNVSGSGFSVIQQPQILITQSEQKFTESCRMESDTIMSCTSPRIDLPNQVSGDSILNVTTGFIMDGVTDLLTWCDLSNQKSCTPMEYFQNPEYYPFTDVVYGYEDGVGLKDGEILLIHGERLDLAVTSAEVIVYIGPDFCTEVIVNRRALSCQLPENEPAAGDYLGMNTSKGLPVVWVIHGTTLAFNIGYFRYPNMTSTVLITSVVSVTFLVIFMVIVVTVLSIKYYKQKKSLRQYHERLLCEIRAIHEEFRKSANRNKQPSTTAERENTENVRPSSKSQSKNIMLSDKVRIMPEDVKISYDQLRMGRVLGQGAFGKVYKAVLKDYQAGSQSEVAVKTIQDVNDPTNTVKFLEEGLLMKNFNHPNVLGLLGLTFGPQGQPLIVLPFMANGDLKSYLVKRKKDLAPIQLVMFALHVALGMEYLAQQKFVHRDLAARNCMIDEELVVKIADFGLSRDLEESDYYTSGDKQAKLPIKWMAPESMERRVYTTKTDVWSYGVLLWELFSGGSKPYPGVLNRDVYTYLKQGQRMNPPKFCPRKIGEIMQHCWQDNRKMRCSFQEIVTKLKDLVETMHDDAAPEMGQESSLELGESSGLAKEKAAVLTDELQEKSKGVDRSSYLIPLTAMESVKVDCGSSTSSEETDQQYTHSYTNISGV